MAFGAVTILFQALGECHAYWRCKDRIKKKAVYMDMTLGDSSVKTGCFNWQGENAT